MLPDTDMRYGEVVDKLTIDDLDRQLTQCLGVDGRASFASVAEVLGVSDQTIARRYRRLRSSGALRVVGLPSPKKGWASWFLRMRCVPGSGEAIAAALARRDDTAWVQLLSGDTEVLCALRGDRRARVPRRAAGVQARAAAAACPGRRRASGRARTARRRAVRGARGRRPDAVRRPRGRHRLVGDDRAAADGPAPRRRAALLRLGARHAGLRLPVDGV